ncbi:hypothetical protein QBC47DRAFT_417470 [Echria macrotheca]|uniref:chitinase n=1 Tax=Echria macrotheca TaxID=438768 RepID=A0AAJ0F7D4_9PEZI|nr:hypothetical protein QBC47DRAFT_417470 [Echria macrotheca]
MARSVTLLTALAICLFGGSVVSASDTRPPSITHQNPSVDAHPDPLSDYVKLRDNGTTEVEVGAAAPSSPIPPLDMASVFRRQVELPGDGALLCPTGICADGSCCGPQNICGYGPDFCGVGCKNNCTAKAMCGQYSEGGTQKCGLDLCCSWGGWCGTTAAHCVGPDQWSLCQQGFGKCQVVRPTEYSYDSGISSGRTIGYYQSWNTRNRACNRVWPSQIKKEQYTHLYFAFASINPTTFEIAVAHPGDVALMAEFTALKGPRLQTWIAVGGYDFSDKGTPTHTTWSDLCSTPARRAAFISSVRTFMETYGFQGVDLDWEYPVDKDRGGRPEDVVNFVSLVREMRLAFGTSYGISLTLAPDYWYLRWFDAKGLEPWVDHMGFMAYDLHGFWDMDVLALGAIVRGQADIREIYNNSIPLAYAELDFSKIDFGVAWYGRGYTLQDPNCNTLGCPFKGPSKPSKCTNAAGVMSLDEINDLIAEKGLEPRLLQSSMMKEVVWDDQWIGYDDEGTVGMKKAFANKLGFGGTMAWSVDFYTSVSERPPVSTDGSCGPANGGTICEGSGFGDCCSANGWCGSTPAHCGSGCISGKCIQGAVTTDGSCGAGNNNAICGDWPAGNCCSAAGWCGSSPDHCGAGCQSGACTDRNEVVFLDRRVYQTGTAKCQPPCTLVLPPIPLESPLTISMPPFTTSLEVGSSAGGTFAVTTTTITVVVQSIVVTAAPQSNVVVTNGQTAALFNPTASIVIPPSTVTVTNGLGQTSQRVVEFPPWPSSAWGTGPWVSGSVSFSSSTSSTSTTTQTPWTYTPPPYTRPPIVLPCSGSYGVQYVAEYDAYVTLSRCEGPVTIMERDCAPTTTVSIEEPTTKSFTLGCTLFTGTGTPGELEWDDDDNEDGEKKSSCNLWFFWTCIFGIRGWRWKYPPGIYPPGPPPYIKLPTGMTIQGFVPTPWPRVTLGWDRKPTFPVLKPGRTCTTRTADVCSTTTTLDITTSGTSTRTSTRTQSECSTIRGCRVEDDDWESTTITATCSRPTIITGRPSNNLGRAEITSTTSVTSSTETTPTSSVPSSTATLARQPFIGPRQNPNDACAPLYAGDVIIYPVDPYNTGAIIAELIRRPAPSGGDLFDKTTLVDADTDYISFLMVAGMDSTQFSEIWNQRYQLGISWMYSVRDYNSRIGNGALVPGPYNPPFFPKKRGLSSLNSTVFARQSQGNPQEDPKGNNARYTTGTWELSLMSVPPGATWDNQIIDGQGSTLFTFDRYENGGEGQIIYLVEEGIDTTHKELATRNIDVISIPRLDFGWWHQNTPDLSHGTQVASKLVGPLLSMSPKARVILAPAHAQNDPLRDKLNTLMESVLVGIVRALDHIIKEQKKNAALRGKQIINISWAAMYDLPDAVIRATYLALKKLDELGVVIVMSTHNYFLPPFDDPMGFAAKNKLDRLFTRFAQPRADPGERIPNIIAVSGIGQDTKLSPHNPWEDWVALAPGFGVSAPAMDPTNPATEYKSDITGASVAAPLVASTIAYWRSLLDLHPGANADSLKDPADVKGLVMAMHRRVPQGNRLFSPARGHEPVGNEAQKQYDAFRPWGQRMHNLWVGTVPLGNCVVEPGLPGCPWFFLTNMAYRDLDPWAADPNPNTCQLSTGWNINKRQEPGAAPSCSLVFDAPRSSSAGPTTATSALTYTPGVASPTCTASCGSLCSGYYCHANATGNPPVFHDPKDPRFNSITTSSRSSGLIVTPPPELPPLPPGPTCTGREFATTTLICNGGGGGMACINSVICTTSTQNASPPGATTTPPPDLPDLDLPDIENCPRPLSTATTYFGHGQYATSLWCPPPTPTRPPPSVSTGPFPSDDFFAVIESQLESYDMTPGRIGRGCRPNSPLYEIRLYKGGHAPSTGYGCDGDGTYIDEASWPNPGEIDGCQRPYEHGWRVCLTNYGGNVHTPDGWHQRCLHDDTTIRNCKLGFCPQIYVRKLKCDGVWWKDAA